MQQAIERLELAALGEALAARAKTALGRSRTQALGPFMRRGDAVEQAERTTEARGLLERDLTPPLEGATDVRVALDLASKGMMLDGPQLRAVAATMLTGAGLRRFLLSREDDAPRLYGIGAMLGDIERPAMEISRSFDPSGQLADTASPELGTLRRRLRSLQGGMEEKLNELMGSAKIKRVLQEPYFTVRADRYVLPIKASFQGEVKGIVHDASGTGHTVFIEPQEVVDAGNRLKIAHSQVLEEEHRILSQLTLLVVDEDEAIRVAMDVIGHADMIFSAGQLSIDLECHPVPMSDGPGFNLIAARHPQLILQKMDDPTARLVANDVGLDSDQKVLILTGPNTGGKTVAMKTVGLMALMARCGLHLPCDPKSTIGWYDHIEVAIGDDQSIASKLSTFAAHMSQLNGIIERAGTSTLVLVDEIAADTDPTQGQALAQAILEAFADAGAHTIVTTHFEGLKALPFADPRFRNAGVGFDPARFCPTYRLTLDVPQGSNGFDIAQTLGLNTTVVDRARSLTGAGTRAIESLMKALESKTAELGRATDAADDERQQLAQATADLEAQRRALEEEQRSLRDNAQHELLEDIKRRRAEVSAIVADLQQFARTEEIADAMRRANEAAQEIAEIEAVEASKVETRNDDDRVFEPLDSCEVGDWVHVPRLAKDGAVVAVDGKDSVVAIGNMRTRVPTRSLRRARTKAPRRGPEADRLRIREDSTHARPPMPITSAEEIDVRGLSSDEAISRIDGFLDHHYGSATTHIRVIHGHGTGALRSAIRAHLKRSGYTRSWRAGDEKEGGDGATITELA